MSRLQAQMETVAFSCPSPLPPTLCAGGGSSSRTPLPSMSVRQAGGAAQSRRRFLAALAVSPVLLTGMARTASAGIQTTMSDGGFVDPEDASELEARAGGATVSMLEFRNLLDGGKVSRVWFFGITNNTCYFESDGKIARIGEGYPVEDPGSPESPLWVMAQVRDRSVPYTMSPISRRFLRKQPEKAQS